MASSPITLCQIDEGKVDAMTDFLFLGSKITVDSDCSYEIKRHLLLGRKAMRNLDSVLKSRDSTLLTKVCIVKAMFFSSSHVWMWKLDHKEDWVSKNWGFWIVVLEKILESPLDCMGIKPVNPSGKQPCIFFERTVAGTDTLATWCEKPPTHWKRCWCWERLKAKRGKSSRDQIVR